MKRIVIKIGSQIILDDEEGNSNYLSNILNEIVSLKSKGFSFTIVSSGAVALAKKHITIKKSQEGTTSSKQALSSIGQVYLMNKYKSFFNLHNIECAQVLAGRDNFNSRLAYLNIRSALEELYSYNVIPIINENAHEEAITSLTKNTFSFTVDDAMRSMVEFNSLAIADFFWFKLGEHNLRVLMNELALSDTEMPVPFSGIYSTIATNLAPILEKPIQNYYGSNSSANRDSLFSLMIETAEKYAQNDSLNLLRVGIMSEDRINLSFIQERDALPFFPQTTASDITSLLSKLWNNEIINEEVSKNIKEKMRWAFNSASMTKSFSDYGAFYDARMGMLSGIDFGTSIYDNHTSVQAVFFDKLPVAFWLHMSANHMQEDYQQRLIWDPALYQTTIQNIKMYE